MINKRYLPLIILVFLIFSYVYKPFYIYHTSYAAQIKPEDTYIEYNFEDKNILPWEKNDKNLDLQISTNALDGKYSLRLGKRKNYDDGIALDVTKLISYKKEYFISFYARQKTNLPQRIIVYLDLTASDTESKKVVAEKVIMPNTWSEIKGSFVSSYKNIKTAKISICMQSSKSDDFFIDNFTIKGSNMVNIIRQDGFENKSIYDWRAEDKNCRLMVTKEKAYEGTYSLKVQKDSNKNGNILIPIKWLKMDGKNYDFSLYIFNNNKKNVTFEIGLKTVNGKTNKYIKLGNKNVSSNKWVELSASYIFDSKIQGDLYFYIKPVTVANTYYIDKFIISDEEWDKPMVELNIPSLYEKYKNYFKIGVALPYRALTNPDDVLLIKKHFNSITAENEMKPISVQPTEDGFSFVIADQYVDFCKKNNIALRGHTLVWHQQTPSWFFTNPETGELLTNSQKDKKILLDRLKKHIQTVVGRYKGKVYAWDVVNEAIDENEPDGFRKSEWFNILGTEYIEKAFIWAHEKDPQAKLYYNDYSTENPVKREFIYNLVKNLKQKGVPIDGIGLQCHISVDWPSVDEVEKTINLFSSIPGIELQITELDISIAKNLTEGDDEQKRYLLIKQAEKLRDLFEVFKRHKNVIKAVTFWGLKDDYSWLKGDYPLLFDENYQAKFSYWGIVEPSVLPNE